jgi:hypothetical protein
MDLHVNGTFSVKSRNLSQYCAEFLVRPKGKVLNSMHFVIVRRKITKKLQIRVAWQFIPDDISPFLQL